MSTQKTRGGSPKQSLDDRALAYLKRKGSAEFEQLYSELKTSIPSLTKAELAELVWRLVGEDQAVVEEIPPATNSFLEYIGIWENNLWIYASMAVSIITVLVIYASPLAFPLVVLRWILGSFFVLFIPGYVTIEALFPKGRELDVIERVALSLGLSLALVPLIGLLLNFTPWGIRLEPIVSSLTIFTGALGLVALGRRFRMSVERFELQKLA